MDHSRTYTLDDIVVASLLRREVATKIQALLEAKDYSPHHSEAAVITPTIVLTIINCLQLRHDYLQLTDYIGHFTATTALLSLGVERKIWAKVSISNSRQCRLGATLRCHGVPRFPNQSIHVIPEYKVRRFPVPQKRVDAEYVKDCVTASMCHMIHSRLFFHCFSSRNPPS